MISRFFKILCIITSCSLVLGSNSQSESPQQRLITFAKKNGRLLVILGLLGGAITYKLLRGKKKSFAPQDPPSKSDSAFSDSDSDDSDTDFFWSSSGSTFPPASENIGGFWEEHERFMREHERVKREEEELQELLRKMKGYQERIKREQEESRREEKRRSEGVLNTWLSDSMKEECRNLNIPLSSNPFQVLELDPSTANEREVSLAYKKLARESHPDKDKTGTGAERFKIIAACRDKCLEILAKKK
jgi:hypothetical protein